MATIDRREVLLGAFAAAGASSASAEEVITLPFENGQRPLVRYPEKRALLRLTARPPQLETPFSVFDESVLTPNDAFFVRYHLADAPPQVNEATYRLDLQGFVEKPLKLSLSQLKAMPQSEVVAVNQCSGNGRGFSEPRVAGGQAGNGLMGNARWRGVSLKHLLTLAGVRPGAVQVGFNGLDNPVMDGTPDFQKALAIEHAMDGDVMLAWSMNGRPLPLLNGWPLRLVAPGYYGTYWVKHLNEITVLDKPLDSFWMNTAYRIPDNDCACVAPGARPEKTRPIGKLNVRSFITSLQDGARLKRGAHRLRGVAFDGGSGVAKVEVSIDDGATWRPAKLGDDLGRFSFRAWTADIDLPPGKPTLKVRATSAAGEVQPDAARWNPSAYMRNVVEAVKVEVA